MPETGKKVYQVVYEEFQFLVGVLTRKRALPRKWSAWRSRWSKGNLAIQYTIEMRNMLKDMPVRDEIRDFCSSGPSLKLLAVALCVLQHKGHLDAEVCCKTWCGLPAKPNRADRAKVIQDLPNLLLRRYAQARMTAAMAPASKDKNIRWSAIHWRLMHSPVQDRPFTEQLKNHGCASGRQSGGFRQRGWHG